MMDNRIPYDKSVGVWSPEGELIQLSYARRASEKGLPAMALILNDKAILMAARIKVDDLIEAPSKIKVLDDNLYFLAAGLSSDSNLLLVQARYIAQRQKMVYGEPIGPEGLARQLGDIMAQQTFGMGTRALGSSIIVLGFHGYSKIPKIFYVDNGGAFFATKAYAAGQDQDKIINYFRKNYKQPMTEAEGKKLVIDAMNSTTNDPTKILTEKDIEFLVITKDTE